MIHATVNDPDDPSTMTSDVWHNRLAVRSLIGLTCVAFVGAAVSVHNDGDALAAFGALVIALLALWSTIEAGHARGRSQRTGTASACNASFRGSISGPWLFLLMLGAVGLPMLLVRAGAPSAVVIVLLTGVSAGLMVSAVGARRRRTRTLGFDPDQYLAIARTVSQTSQRPEFLVHHTLDDQPSFSGWYAYAREQDQAQGGDFVTWTMQDLVDVSPEAAVVLREREGSWSWDRERHAYERLEDPDLGLA